MQTILDGEVFRTQSDCGVEGCSLTQIFAALVADRIETFPALRAHQEPAWHMFLVQLGAIAMHRADLVEPPTDAAAWRDIIRNLTREEFPNDEPWHLVVEDMSKPAFLQPPVPADVRMKDSDEDVIRTPDALDMLITSRNHDLKQSVATAAHADDWIFALISLQTSEGFGGRNNYGIVRMNGGSSSRVFASLAPMAAASGDECMRPGPRFTRDLRQLLARRDELLERFPLGYPESGGLALTWTKPWPDGDQLALSQLDIFFIEVCRRVRLRQRNGNLEVLSGTSSAERIAGKQFKGALGDPWAPVHTTDAKALTIGDEGRFDYKRIVELLSPDWELPLLAQLGSDETKETANWLLVLKAFARGNSKTGGFKERIIPLKGKVARGLGARRRELHALADEQTRIIAKVDTAVRNALALASAGGDRDEIEEANYARSRPLRARLDTIADRLFFPALWDRFEAEQAGDGEALTLATNTFIRALVEAAETLLEEGLADIPCPSIRRPRAETRARREFWRRIAHKDHGFPHLYARSPADEETPDAA